MGEVIHLREIRRARRPRRVKNREEIARAVEIFKDNLAAVVEELRAAPSIEQSELLDRAEKLIALIRYGRLMLGEEFYNNNSPASADSR
jgi:hypothetical protein